MKRISRHTVVALVVVLLASLGGLGLAVTAFGQDASSTDPTSGYTQTNVTTTPTTVPVAPPSTVTEKDDDGSAVEGKSPRRSKPTHGSGTPVASPPQTSRVTRDAPTTLAFTGADPMLLGGAGLLLMLAGLGLHLRRRKTAAPRL